MLTRFDVKLPRELRQWLDEEAERNGSSAADVVRRLLFRAKRAQEAEHCAPTAT